MRVRLVQLPRIPEPPTIIIKSREDPSRALNVRLLTQFRKHRRSRKKLGEYGVKRRIRRGRELTGRNNALDPGLCLGTEHLVVGCGERGLGARLD